MDPEEQEGEEGFARPRRMSEVNAATKILPIPPASSFFVFSQTNRCLATTIHSHLAFKRTALNSL